MVNPDPKSHLPRGLVESFKRERAAVFCGAGASATAGLPDWQQFVAALAADVEIVPDGGNQTYSPTMLLNAPQYYENRYGRRRLIERVTGMIERPHSKPSSTYELVAQLPCSLYYTTNFDELLEDSLRRHVGRYELVVSDEGARIYSDRRGRQLRKIHGTISQPSTLVVTRSDYAMFVMNNTLTLDALRNDLAQYSFLFIGYSLNDPDFNSIYDNVMHSMGRMRQTHYMCVPSLTPFEEQDLRERGIEPIDLSLWKGERVSEKLDSFLIELVEATSEVVHVRRFFSGLDTDQEIPAIITSRLHETEKYVYFPMCDLYVAQQIERALGLIGCRANIMADHHALARYDECLRKNLVLICSPFGNAFTKRIFDDIALIPTNISARWETCGNKRYIKDLKSGHTYGADDPLQAHGEPQTEYALIARYRNPWALGKKIFLFAGVNALGTHATGKFMSDTKSYRRLPWQEEDFTAILRITYSHNDPYDYDYEIAGLDFFEA